MRAMTDDGVFTWRPIVRTDAASWAALLAAIRDVDRTWEFFDEDDLLEDFDDPYRDFADGSAGIFDGATMIGYGVIEAKSAAYPRHDMHHHGGVHPDYRRRGLGQRLVQWAEASVVALHEQRHPGRPLSLSATSVAGNAGAAALFSAYGYETARWFHGMAADIVQVRPSPPPPAGIRIVEFTAQRAADTLRVRNEAFRDHWRSTDLTAEQWDNFLGISAFRPAFSFLAYDDMDEPLGIVISHEYDAYAEATGIRDLYVAVVATRRTQRRRGIASTLLTHALAEAKQAGFTAASLSVDADSLTGALGLYRRIGFMVEHTSITYTKPLLASAT
jgi:mycothiol synthase